MGSNVVSKHPNFHLSLVEVLVVRQTNKLIELWLWERRLVAGLRYPSWRV